MFRLRMKLIAYSVMGATLVALGLSREARSQISGTPYHLGQIGAGGTTIGDSTAYAQPTITLTGTVTSGSTFVTSVSSLAGLIGGNVMVISGTNIPAGTTITTVASNTSQITISAAPTGSTVSETLTVSYVALPAITIPTQLLPRSLNGYIYASQNQSPAGTQNGIASSFANPPISTIGGTVIADPIDSPVETVAGGNAFPDNTHLIDQRPQIQGSTNHPDSNPNSDYYQNFPVAKADYFSSQRIFPQRMVPARLRAKKPMHPFLPATTLALSAEMGKRSRSTQRDSAVWPLAITQHQ